MAERIVIGITGASGVIYGIRSLFHLKKTSLETHLILSEAAKKNIDIETDYTVSQVEQLADVIYRENDMPAPVASGSFVTSGMVVAPCTIKTLSGIVNSYNDSLLVRTADVMLKEKRKLVLVVRETPLHKGHLELLTRAADIGAHILPPFPAFYHRPQTIEDIVDHTIGKIFDFFQIPHDLFKRWDGQPIRVNN